jgi:UDP-N-acetylmuramoyl-tripeptide--D-alanyl-D-alanine ligase
MPTEFGVSPLTLAQVLGVLAPDMGVPWAGDLAATDIVIDSRLAGPGSLFVAFAGEQVDGHDYVSQALVAGATLALIERLVNGVPVVDTIAGTWPNEPTDAVAIRVPSTLGALQALARDQRAARPDLRVIGVTGSIGKTTTKEVIAGVLEQRYTLLKSRGNHNNEIGLPLTLMTLRPEHQRAVLEMGMYALGEIADLCAVAQPQVGVVTSVAPIHLERLGTIERIAQAKAELPQALPADGVAVLNADDPRVAAMAGQTRAQVVTFGEGPSAHVRAATIRGMGLDGSIIDLAIAEHALWPGQAGEHRLRIRLVGRPAVAAALAAVAVGLVEGLTWPEIERGLAGQTDALRLAVRPGRDGIMLLDDSYNSSPPAVLAALDLLQELNSRRVAVLGDMLELGTVEAEAHREVGEWAAERCDLLITVGPRARGIAEAAVGSGMASDRVHALGTNQEAIARLDELLQPEDAVLVKGSRSMQMEEIVKALGVTSS